MSLRRFLGRCFFGLAIIILPFALIFTTLAVSRIGLDYNELGRYFDAEAGVVYDVDALLAYAFLSLVTWLGAILFFTGYYWLRRSQAKQPTHNL